MSTTRTRSGRCLCGETCFETRGEPSAITLRDCDSCRRAAGAAGVAWCSWHPDQVSFSGRTPARFESSGGRHRGFCDRCATTLSWRTDAFPEHLDLTVAVFEPEQRGQSTLFRFIHRRT